MPAVADLSLSIGAGEALSVIGPSGAGKSATARALMGLERSAEVTGCALWRGANGAACDLLDLPARQQRPLCGRQIAMIFQDPATALNPVLTVERQVGEAMRVHLGLDRAAIRARMLSLLARVGLPAPEAHLGRYVHQLSGGQRQRVMIAAALACDPRLLIADEPTTALDAPLRAGILDLLDGLRRERGLALLLITHDMRAVRRIGGRVAVMQAGRIVEHGRVADVLAAPHHVQTRALVEAQRLVEPNPHATGAPVLQIRDLTVRHGGAVAVNDVSLTLARGETLALVGRSGCGKSSLARAALGLERDVTGAVLLEGADVLRLRGRARRAAGAQIQMVFQDVAGSLDPRRRLGRQVADPLRNHGRPCDAARIKALFAEVGLEPGHMHRFPHEVSGGQRQRAAIARALALDPAVLLVDEGLSALDSVAGAAILRLLRGLQERLGLAMLFITHDLHAAGAVAHRIAVMQAGRLVETGAARDLLSAPRHPHARALIAASGIGPLGDASDSVLYRARAQVHPASEDAATAPAEGEI